MALDKASDAMLYLFTHISVQFLFRVFRTQGRSPVIPKIL